MAMAHAAIPGIGARDSTTTAPEKRLSTNPDPLSIAGNELDGARFQGRLAASSDVEAIEC